MDTILQRIHNVFVHHRALSATPEAQRLITSTGAYYYYHQTTASYVVNCALINLRYLGQHLKSLLSSFYTRILRGSLHHHVQHLIFRKPYNTYPNPTAEQQYWDSAERGLRQLRLSDARFVGSERPKNVRVPEMPPLVMYYVPALLPQYRDSDEKIKRQKRGIEENGCHFDPEDYDYRIAFSDSDD